MARLKVKDKVISIILFTFGISLFLYPTVSDMYYSYAVLQSRDNANALADTIPTVQDENHGAYKEEDRAPRFSLVSDTGPEQNESVPDIEPLLDKSLKNIKAYNKKLWENAYCSEGFFGESSALREDVTFPGDEECSKAFAFISVDRINLTLPIYLGATKEHLDKGAAVIKGTSIPIGGNNTNAVIAAHTGRIMKLFTDLTMLEQGDVIRITNRWGTLFYKVTGNKIIWPKQEEYLGIVEGKDILTLLTCYHGTPENDRLIVFAQRYYPVQSEEIKKEYIEDIKVSDDIDYKSYSYLSNVELKVKPWYFRTEVYLILAMVILICLFLYRILI